MTTLIAVPATAQPRSATIRVSATVVDFAVSDVVGAVALGGADPWSAPAAPAGASMAHDDWRISAGGTPEIQLQLEALDGGPARAQEPWVGICDVVDGAFTECRAQTIPTLRMSVPGSHPEFLVRVGRDADGSADSAEPTPLRLTIAYTAT